MKNKMCHKGDHHLRYNLNKWKKKGCFDILNGISEILINIPCTLRSEERRTWNIY